MQEIGFRIQIVFPMKYICARQWLLILSVFIKQVWKCTECDKFQVLLACDDASYVRWCHFMYLSDIKGLTETIKELLLQPNLTST